MVLLLLLILSAQSYQLSPMTSPLTCLFAGYIKGQLYIKKKFVALIFWEDGLSPKSMSTSLLSAGPIREQEAKLTHEWNSTKPSSILYHSEQVPAQTLTPLVSREKQWSSGKGL